MPESFHIAEAPIAYKQFVGYGENCFLTPLSTKLAALVVLNKIKREQIKQSKKLDQTQNTDARHNTILTWFTMKATSTNNRAIYYSVFFSSITIHSSMLLYTFSS